MFKFQLILVSILFISISIFYYSISFAFFTVYFTPFLHKKTKANSISQSSARIHPMLTVETTVALCPASLVNYIQVPIQASSSFDNLKFFWINIKHPKLVRKVQRFQRKHQRNSWGVRQTKLLMWLLMRLLNQKDYTK